MGCRAAPLTLENCKMTPESSGEKTRAHLKIRGRVQGVYYRASMVREAQNLGLTGWVRNCDDGSVEAVAEGMRGDIESLIAWSRRGPAGARVDKVEVQWEAPDHSFFGFVVRR
jgi:acylphosphatase